MGALYIREKARPSRRVWIPKPGRPSERRPLGIPTITDRAKQTLVKMTLEPEWEAKFRPNTYGFRPGRSCHDAIEAIFSTLKRKTAYCLDADISGCFDNINHNALLKKLNTTPTITKVIKGWLKAGIMEGGMFQPTKSGTIQGGTISPLLANIALHGLEEHIKTALTSELFSHKKEKLGQTSHRDAQSALNVTVYADDFVILHESEEIIFKAKTLTEEWLKTIGLELRSSKTRISHTLNSCKGRKPGFDFLGFVIRQYPVKCSKKGYKLLIKPSHKSIKQYKLAIKQKIRKMRGAPQEGLIKELNPIIKGWSRYYTSVVSSRIFRSLDNAMNRKLWKWALYRHNNKGKCWIKRKYFKKYDNDNWRFMTNNNVILTRHSDNAIKRHTKVKGSKSPYDGDWVYWGSRISKVPGKSFQVIRMMKRQQGRCGYCNLWFRFDDFVHIHHQDRNRGNNNSKNLLLLHKHCHDQLHGSVHDKH